MKAAPEELETGEDFPESEAGKMSFLEHLDELRKRLVRIIAYVGAGFVACFYFHDRIYAFLSRPITSSFPELKLVFTKPTEPFTLYIKVSILAAIFLTAPFILFEVWKFIAPGLYRREKRFAIPFLVSSVMLFVGGGAFCYYIVLPRVYTFLVNFGADFQPMITITEYLDITITMLLGFGLIFEMPVIVAFLSMFGLVTARFLWVKFKYAVLIIFLVAAVLSPTPDVVNQAFYAGPMVVLYLISIGIAYLFGLRRKKMQSNLD